MKEVNELLKRLGELDDAPMIWINKKVYENPREIERLKKQNENLEVMYQDIVTQAEWHDEELKEEIERLKKENKRLNKCIDTALEIIIKDWNDKCTIPIHAVVDTGEDIRVKLYYQLFLKGVDKE